MRADLRRDHAASANRDAQDHEISAFYGRRIGLHDMIGNPQLGNPPARGRGAGGADDGVCDPLRARGTRDR